MGDDGIEARIGYTFRDPQLLRRALTHSSVRVQEGTSYDRLEFLGDAVLGMTVSEHLFHEWPQENEGTLTRMKSLLVSGQTLTEVSRRLQIDEHALVDKGVARRGLPDSLLADLFEAVAGAVYVDGGLEAAQQFVLRSLAPELRQPEALRAAVDPKSRLQHCSQKRLQCDPAYRIIAEAGPPHEKLFRAAVQVGDDEFVSPWAPTKAAAEQEAATAALRALDPDEAPLTDERQTAFDAEDDQSR